MAELIILFCCGGIIIAISVVIYSIYMAKRKMERERKEKINRKRPEWGNEICNLLIEKRIAVDMTEEMVRLSWGTPSRIEQKEITKSAQTTRWVYGTPRRGARYIWFKNGVVTKIKL